MVDQESDVFGLAAQRRDADDVAGEQFGQLGIVDGVCRAFIGGMAAGNNDAHVVTVCLAEYEADAVLDVFAVLRGVAQIKRAARCFLQQFQRRVGNEFDAAESDPRRAAFVEITGNDFKR